MTASPAADSVRSIDCTNCGAGLSVLGGGRVTTQVCSYCGAVLDTNDAYRVLKVFADMPRPETPFRLGMTGKLDGVDFTIIGILGQVERWDGVVYTWVDHQLFSPTHGYTWLTVEDGHTLVTRKTRDWPSGALVTERTVERAETPPSRTWRGRNYRYYSTTNWETVFVEGEFNWRPEYGAKGQTISLMPTGAASDMLAYVTGKGDGAHEREIEITRYWPDAATAFDAEPPAPHGVHPLQPYTAKAGAWYYTALFGALSAACLVGIVMLGALNGGSRVIWNDAPPPGATVLPFEITDPSRPARLRLRHDLRNDWADFDIGLTGPSGDDIADTSRTISYYSGVEGGESWSEGSRSATLGFQPTMAGEHRLTLALAQGGSPGTAQANLRIVLEEARGNRTWLALALIVFGAALIWSGSARFRHRLKRWKNSDWSSD